MHQGHERQTIHSYPFLLCMPFIFSPFHRLSRKWQRIRWRHHRLKSKTLLGLGVFSSGCPMYYWGSRPNCKVGWLAPVAVIHPLNSSSASFLHCLHPGNWYLRLSSHLVTQRLISFRLVCSEFAIYFPFLTTVPKRFFQEVLAWAPDENYSQ